MMQSQRALEQNDYQYGWWLRVTHKPRQRCENKRQRKGWDSADRANRHLRRIVREEMETVQE